MNFKVCSFIWNYGFLFVVFNGPRTIVAGVSSFSGHGLKFVLDNFDSYIINKNGRAKREDVVPQRYLEDDISGELKSVRINPRYARTAYKEVSGTTEFIGETLLGMSDEDALKKSCGINVEDYFNTSNRNLSDFCFDSSKKNKEQRNRYLRDEISEDARKCYTFLCGWYQERCYESELFDQSLQRCYCLYRVWNLCGCLNIFNVKEKLLYNLNASSSVGDDNEVIIKRIEADDTTSVEIGLGYDDRHKVVPMYAVPASFQRSGENLYQNDGKMTNNNEDELSLNSRVGTDDEDRFIFIDDEETVAPWQRPRTTSKPSSDPFDIGKYGEEEKKCFALKSVWYKGGCHKLNLDDVCGDETLWLVLEEPKEGYDMTSLKPVCKPKKCIENNEIWWPSEQSCLKRSEAKKKYCPGIDSRARYDVFGNGYCGCADESHGTFENQEDCYKFYQQGPCDKNEVVSYSFTSGYAICSQDLCFELNKSPQKRTKQRTNQETETRNKRGVSKQNEESSLYINTEKKIQHNSDDILQLQRDPYVFNLDEDKRSKRLTRQATNQRSQNKKLYAPIYGNGTCYKLGSAEPCNMTTEERFVFHEFLKIPVCYDNSLELHLIDSKPGCKVDETNKCREEINLQQTSEIDFLLSLKKQARRKRNAGN